MFKSLNLSLIVLIFFFSIPASAVSTEPSSLHNMTLDDFLIQRSHLVYLIIVGAGVIALLLSLLTTRNRQLSDSRDHLTRILSEQDAVISAIPELMFEMNIEGTYLNVWARSKLELTASKSLLLGKNVFDILATSEARKFVDALQDADTHGKSHGVQIKMNTIGEEKWFELSISQKDPENGTQLFIVLSRDITESKLNQQRLKASQDRYQGLFENMADGVAIFRAVDDGEDFTIIDYNRAGERIDWVRRKDLIGEKVTEALPEIKHMGLFDVLQKVWASANSETFAASYTTFDGFKVWRDYYVYKLNTDELVAIYSDDTARRLAEQNLKDSENQQKLILKTIPDLIWLKDIEGNFLSCNPVFERFFGAPESEIVGKTDYDFVDTELADFFRQHDRAVMEADHPITNEEWITFPDNGQKALLETTKSPLKTWDGQLIGVLGIGHDVTERHKAIEATSLSASVFTYSHEGIIITDANSNIIDVNPACTNLTGYSREELIGSNPRIFSSGAQSKEFYQEMWASLNRDGHWDGEIENRKKSGELYTERLIIDRVFNELGELTHSVGVFSDITYLKRQEEELERVAYTDALTGLPNRLLLHDRMQQAFHQSERSKKMVCIGYLDLDGFKPINDQYGHEAGDEVLIEVSSRLQKAVRTGDTVARLGGDEFVLLVLNIHSIFELEQLLKRLLIKVAKPHVLPSGDEVKVSASIGIALYPMDDADPDTLLRQAEQAMYTAKNLGKNRYSFFDASEERRASVTHHLQKSIDKALRHDEFFLLYQPKVNMKTGETIGVEALIRWMHPDKGIIGPTEFLPSIENNALIVALGDWVLVEVLTQMREWRKKGNEIKVSVNIAALQLQREDFVESLIQLFEKFPDVPPHHLELEILETAALQNIEHVSDIMKRCQELGISFALDDFGTGYSSLTYLKQLPAQVIKIDQSFIRDLLDDPDDVAITEGILGLTQAFNRTPIAEGVETIHQGTLLLSLGCRYAQGFGIARPMLAEDLPDWIEHFEVADEWREAGTDLTNDEHNSLLQMALEHHRMVSQVLTAVEQSAPSLLPDNVKDFHACKFGDWLESEGSEKFGDMDIFQPLLEKHQRLHKVYGETAAALKRGDEEVLQQNCVELKQIRHFILDSLNTIRHQNDDLN